MVEARVTGSWCQKSWFVKTASLCSSLSMPATHGCGMIEDTLWLAFSYMDGSWLPSNMPEACHAGNVCMCICAFSLHTYSRSCTDIFNILHLHQLCKLLGQVTLHPTPPIVTPRVDDTCQAATELLITCKCATGSRCAGIRISPVKHDTVDVEKSLQTTMVL